MVPLLTGNVAVDVSMCAMDDAEEPPPAQPWQQLMQVEQPTRPQPIVDRLRGTPFHEPRRMDTPEDDDARAAVEFGLRLGELLFRSGAGTRDVEASLIAVTTALGLSDVEVDITVQFMVLQHAPAGRPPLTLVRVARTHSRDHARLTAVHRLVTDLADGRCSRADAEQRLTDIENAPKPWPRWTVSMAYGVLAASVCLLASGTARAALLAFLTSVCVDQLGRVLSRFGVQPFFVTFVGAAVASVVAALAVYVGLLAGSGAGALVAGGIVVLLPGRVLVCAVEDAISGFAVTASGRVLAVLLTGAGIIAGVGVGLGLARRLHLVLDVDPLVTSGSNLSRGLVAAAVASVATAIAHRSQGQLVLPAMVVGIAGYATFGLLRLTDLAGITAATAVAAVVVGALARLIGGWMRAPALVLSVPALSTLLPGLTIFRAMSELADHRGQGVSTLFIALTVALAIGAGVAFGDFLAAPADRAWIRPPTRGAEVDAESREESGKLDRHRKPPGSDGQPRQPETSFGEESSQQFRGLREGAVRRAPAVQLDQLGAAGGAAN